MQKCFFQLGFPRVANISTNTHFLRFRHRKDSSVVKPDLLIDYSQTRKFGLGTRIARSNRLGKTFQDLSRISIPNCKIFRGNPGLPLQPCASCEVFFSSVFTKSLLISFSLRPDYPLLYEKIHANKIQQIREVCKYIHISR